MADVWIKCSERLPNKSNSYLVTTYINNDGRNIEKAFYFTAFEGWCIVGAYITGCPDLKNVIAWMEEFPKPYMGDI